MKKKINSNLSSRLEDSKIISDFAKEIKVIFDLFGFEWDIWATNKETKIPSVNEIRKTLIDLIIDVKEGDEYVSTGRLYALDVGDGFIEFGLRIEKSAEIEL